jgi:hypothetical protein
MRYAARRDSNDSILRKTAERIGWWLIKTDQPGDYLGGYRGHWYVVEIKDPIKQGHADEFTDSQRKFTAEAFKRQLPVLVWRRDDDVYRDSVPHYP